MYGEMSQQQSTQAKLDAQGGVMGATHVDVTDAQIKAKTQQDVLDAQLKEGGAKDGLLTKSADDLSKAADKLAQTAGTLGGVKTASEIADVSAKEKAGVIDNNGELTNRGRSGIAIKAGEDANAMMGKVAIGENTQDILDKVHKKAYDSEFSTNGEDAVAANAVADKAVAPYMGTDGKALTGQDFWNKQAEMKAGVFSGSNAMMMGDGRMFSGALGTDGEVTGKLSSGISSSADNSIKENDSVMTTTGHGTKDESGYNISPTGLLQKAMTTMGMPEQPAEVLAEMVKDTGIVMAADQIITKGAGRKAASNIISKGYHKARGHEKGINSEGKTIWGSAEKMQKEGFIKGEDGEWKSSQMKSSSGDAPDVKNPTTKNPTNNATGVNTNANTGVDMNNPLNKDGGTKPSSEPSIPKDGESVKPLSQQPINSQIDAQTKYDRKMSSIDADIASKKDLFAKQNELNGGGTPEQLERQKMKIDAMERARSQIAKPDFSAPKEKGFFSRVGDAYDQSSGGFFKKAMGAAAIMTMGAVASEAGTLASATHTSRNNIRDKKIYFSIKVYLKRRMMHKWILYSFLDK